MTLPLLLIVIGISLSAFFSGTETGFYRVTRVRIMLDAVAGSRSARYLLWLTNNPTLFVATALVGNNLANYLVSLAIVLGIHQLAAGQLPQAELLATVAIAPLVFLLGELIPKQLYYEAPYRLLRRSSWPLLLLNTLAFPLVAMLWLMGRILQAILGETPLRVQQTLARNQLARIFKQGEDAGILQPIQRKLAEGLFTTSGRTVGSVATPIGRVPSVPLHSTRQDVFRLARRQRLPMVTVTQPGSRQVEGYVRVIDLYLESQDSITQSRPLMRMDQHESLLAAIIQMQNQDEELAGVTKDDGQLLGIVSCQQLADILGVR